MKILIVRHALAEEGSPEGQDEKRPISKIGAERFREICKNLLHFGWRFDLLLDSPLLRSQQTADIFCEYFSVQNRQRTANLKPLAETAELLREIKTYNKESLVIVGHQPFLTDFIGHCVLKNNNKPFVLLKRGGLALLDFPLAVESGSAILEFLLPPSFLFKSNK